MGLSINTHLPSLYNTYATNVARPKSPSMQEIEQLQADLKAGLDRLYSLDPSLRTLPQLNMQRVAANRLETSLNGLQLSLTTFETSSAQEEDLAKLDLENQQKRLSVSSNLDMLNNVKAGISLTTAAVTLAAAVALGTAGQIPAALALGTSSLLTITTEIADQLNAYEKASKVFSEDLETQTTIAQTMRYGLYFVSFASSLVSGAVGGVGALKDAFQRTFSPEMLSQLSIAAQGIVLFKRATVETEKSEVDVEAMNINMRLTLHRHDLEVYEQRYGDSLAAITKLFDLAVKGLQIQNKISQHIIRGI
jgi:hypothetical protein